MLKRLFALALTVWLIPGAASACAVCFQGNGDDSRLAFIAMTGFLTFLPLIVLGLLVRWIRKRSRALSNVPNDAFSARQP